MSDQMMKIDNPTTLLEWALYDIAHGATPYTAAKACGVHPSKIYRTLERLKMEFMIRTDDGLVAVRGILLECAPHLKKQKFAAYRSHDVDGVWRVANIETGLTVPVFGLNIAQAHHEAARWLAQFRNDDEFSALKPHAR